MSILLSSFGAALPPIEKTLSNLNFERFLIENYLIFPRRHSSQINTFERDLEGCLYSVTVKLHKVVGACPLRGAGDAADSAHRAVVRKSAVAIGEESR